MPEDDLLTHSQVVLALTQRGALFEGSPVQAAEIVEQAFRIALQHCNRLVEGAATRTERAANGGASSHLAEVWSRNDSELERPTKGLFSIEMEAGLDFGMLEGCRAREHGDNVPPYLALTQWLAQDSCCGLGRVRFRRSEVDRWIGQLALPDGGRRILWRRELPRNSRSLARALYEALGAFDFAKPQPTAKELINHLKANGKTVESARGLGLRGDPEQAINVKCVRESLKRVLVAS